MKIIRNLIFALPLLAFASCDSDDVPQVSVASDFGGYYEVAGDDTLYVVDGDNLYLNGITVKSHDGKAATATNIYSYVNGVPAGPVIAYPFVIPSQVFNPGDNSLGFSMNILVVDYAIQEGAVAYNVKLVEDLDDLPDGAQYVAAPNVDSPSDSGNQEGE